MIRRILVAAALTTALSWSAPISAKPLNLIDGDTIIYDGLRIRLQGVNCPEMSQPGGWHAKQYAQSVLGMHHIDRIEDSGKRSYNRVVGRVWLGSGKTLGFYLITSGQCTRAHNYDREGFYAEAERIANRRGLPAPEYRESK